MNNHAHRSSRFAISESFTFTLFLFLLLIYEFPRFGRIRAPSFAQRGSIQLHQRIYLICCGILEFDRIIQCCLHLRLYLLQEILYRDIAALDIGYSLPERIKPFTIVGIIGFL